jgi:hypothetical protein
METEDRLDPQQVERLWAYRGQIDNEFMSRLNFFLVFESVLLAAAVQLPTTGASVVAQRAFVGLGMITTVIWLYSQARVQHILEFLRTLCYEYIPEYRLFRSYRWPVSSTWLLTYGFPIVVLSIWVIVFTR